MSSQWDDPEELEVDLDPNQKAPKQKQPSELSAAVPFWNESTKTPGHEDSSDRAGRGSHQNPFTVSKNTGKKNRASAQNPWFKSFNSASGRITSFALGSVLRRQKTNGEHLHNMAEVPTEGFFLLRTEKSRWRAKVAIVGIMFIVVAVALGVYYSNEEGENSTPGFCGDDADLREDVGVSVSIVGEVLEIDSGVISCLPQDAFSELESLDLTGITDLDFTFTVLNSLSPNAFIFSDGFAAQITSFALKDTKLDEIPKDVLQSFSNLLDVDFSSGKFSEIEEGIFENYTSLDSLILSSNQVLFSFPQALKDLESIGSLDLKDCTNLTSVEEDFFAGITLTNLDLSNTPIVGQNTLEEFLASSGLSNSTTVIGFD